MAESKIVGLVFAAWQDLDRVLEGVSPEDAVRAWEGGSSFAWTVAHVTNVLDGWINVRFQRLAPHPLIGQGRFRMGGSGEAEDWPAIQAGVREVRGAAGSYLEPLTERDLDLVIPYDGSLAAVREHGLSLRYALLRNVAHHYFHVGEIATKRERLGHRPGDYPGMLEEAL